MSRPLRQPIPARLAATEIAYSSENGSGIGPGANEGGIAAYALPSQTIATLDERGLDFFKDLETEWRPTPLRSDDRALISPQTGRPGIHGFVQRYAQLNLDSTIERVINRALTIPGNYYSFVRGDQSVIIVVPSVGRAFLAYNG